MDLGTSILCVSCVVAVSTMVLKFVPGRKNEKREQEPNDPRVNLNDRVVTLEERVRQHAGVLDRMDEQFKAINDKLDQLLRDFNTNR